MQKKNVHIVVNFSINLTEKFSAQISLSLRILCGSAELLFKSHTLFFATFTFYFILLNWGKKPNTNFSSYTVQTGMERFI